MIALVTENRNRPIIGDSLPEMGTLGSDVSPESKQAQFAGASWLKPLECQLQLLST